MDHRAQISMAEVWIVAVGGRGRWPFDAGELIVFMEDVAAVDHSVGESTDGARIHCFLLNNRECTTVPNLARHLSMFCELDLYIYTIIVLL